MDLWPYKYISDVGQEEERIELEEQERNDDAQADAQEQKQDEELNKDLRGMWIRNLFTAKMKGLVWNWSV